jgi:hypothetical protein
MYILDKLRVNSCFVIALRETEVGYRMAYEAKKTEHSGAKKGSGAYWGRKVAAKKESNRRRRENDKGSVREQKDR